MNRFPELKSFLKDGEAESYKGIKVTYIAGRTAVLTIYKDGTEVEKINMHELTDKASMHKLFQEKGFVRKSPDEIKTTEETTKQENVVVKRNRAREMIERHKERRKEAAEERKILGKTAPSYQTTLQLYVGVVLTVLLFAGATGMRQRRKRRQAAVSVMRV